MKFGLGTVSVLVGCVIGLMGPASAETGAERTVSAFEAGEDRAGGTGTHRKARDKNTFSLPFPTLSAEEDMAFRLGNGFFRRIWVSAPASTQAADGLGPLFNSRACQRCHVRDGRGHLPDAGEIAESFFLRLSAPARTDEEHQALASGRLSVIPDPVYGTQLQTFSVQGHAAEGRPDIRWTDYPVTLSGGEVVTLRRPQYGLADLAYGAADPEIMLSPRVAPPMIGLGLLEAIPEQDILAREDPDDADGDGISGRANRVWDLRAQAVRAGRFGWKAGQPTLDQQNQSAFVGDIGLSTPLFPQAWGDCTAAQADCLKAPTGNSPQYDNLEVPAKVTDLVLFYSRTLAVPSRSKALAQSPEVLRGKALFSEVGCASCHVPQARTGNGPGIEAVLADQVIWPYTDLLLHDMGDDLADGRPEGQADGKEWRTPPLWGLGATHSVNPRAGFLHDARARTVLEAVLWHGGEALEARNRVSGLPPPDRDALLAFLNSL